MKNSERRIARGKVRSMVSGVRWRWRARVALRGLTAMGIVSGSVLFLSALGLEQLRFSAESVFWLRWITWGTFVLSGYVFVVRPLLRKVTDQQAALYLEEHEPSLELAVVSALDVDDSASPALADGLVESAIQRLRSVDEGRRVEQSALYRFGGALVAVAVAALLLTALGPQHLRVGLAALLLPAKDAATVNPYAIGVTPGDTTIARGSDQIVAAVLSGFEAADVSVFTRTSAEQSFQRLSMLPDENGDWDVLLLGVDDRTEYFVEATGIRSPTFSIEVADLPYVDQLDITYYFPRYTGLPARTREDGGDVAALAGTVVELSIQPTMAAPGGQLLIDGQPVGDLTVQEDGTLTGRFTISERGYYSIQLSRDNGELVPASPEYAIDVLTDQEPSIQFMTPGRDAPASPIEEVYLQVRATDDYGIGDVRLVYSVNGGPEDTTAIYSNSGRPLPEVSAGHTLFLEEWDLEPGDLVAYYAIARDNRGNARPVASDMFFLNVRPFDIAFRQGEQQQGGGGGGGGQQAETALSELQRQVISATFNLIRQRDSYSEKEFSENVVSVALAQGRLKEQVGTLLQRMTNRGLTESDPGFRDVSAILPQAIAAMDTAQAQLEAQDLRDAIPYEQTALRYLQQAEETYERYVTQQQQQGGGGGGGSQAAAEDLADLFELELDKLQNQYETVRRGQQQQADNEVDELMEQLKELARRQEQEAERQRRRAAQQGQAGGSSQSGQSQRELAEQAEEAARQLQRLAREMNDPSLEETARQLQEAAQSMRQAAAQGGAAGSSEANSALRRLEDARRQLESARADRARRDAEDALRQVEELQTQQREVQNDVRNLPTSGQERADQIEQLRERKNQMTEAVQELERELDNSAAGSRADNPEAARALQDAADDIRESKLKEKLQYSRGTIEQWDPESAVTLELDIESDLQSLRDQLEAVANSTTRAEEDPLREALDEARDLVRGMEAMGRRLEEAQRGSGEGQPGQQQGQEGQGQEGQGQGQGQAGQGQQGQDGRQGEGQQQGEQGQGGQQGQGQRGGDPQGQGGQQGQGQRGGDPQGQQRDGQQGQGGQQGGRQSQGGGGPDGGYVDRGGYFGGATRGNPEPLSPEEIRQLSREFGQRGDQVRDLSQQLRRAGRSAEELQGVLDAMRALEEEGIYADARQVADLQQEILNALKRLEFGLRRDVEGDTERGATLTGSEEVPDGYRKLVEEYYRALARGRSGGGGN